MGIPCSRTWRASIRPSKQQTTATQPPQAIIDFFDAINAEDWDKLASLWVEDAELNVVAARPRRGRHDVIAFYPKALAPYPKHHDDPYRISVAGDVVTVEIKFTGEMADGRPVEFLAVDIIDMRDGKLWKVNNWFDIDHVRRQTS